MICVSAIKRRSMSPLMITFFFFVGDYTEHTLIKSMSLFLQAIQK